MIIEGWGAEVDFKGIQWSLWFALLLLLLCKVLIRGTMGTEGVKGMFDTKALGRIEGIGLGIKFWRDKIWFWTRETAKCNSLMEDGFQ